MYYKQTHSINPAEFPIHLSLLKLLTFVTTETTLDLNQEIRERSQEKAKNNNGMFSQMSNFSNWLLKSSGEFLFFECSFLLIPRG